MAENQLFPVFDLPEIPDNPEYDEWSRQDDHQRRQGGIYAVVPESCQHGAAELPGI